MSTEKYRSSHTIAVAMTIAVYLANVLAVVPSFQDAAKSWSWAWSPREDWSSWVAASLLGPSLAALGFSIRARLMWPIILNAVSTFAWGVVLVLQLMSRTVA